VSFITFAKFNENLNFSLKILQK